MILEYVILPSANKLYGDDDFIFKQDLGPVHSAKTTIYWFVGQDITVLDWPDLNPIDSLRGLVKRKMRNTRPNNTDDLKAAIKVIWATVTPQQCQRLIISMPCLNDAVIHAKGAPMKYQVHNRTFLSEGGNFCIVNPFLLDLTRYSKIFDFHEL